MEKINKGEIQRLFPILKAIKEGKTIQWNDMGVWCDIDGDDEGFVLDTLIGKTDGYRIKPESKYRPFKDTKECWQEMQKHQPFGWVINISNGRAYNLQSVLLDDGVLYVRSSYVELGRAFIDYTFADGTPFGVKVEK